MHINEANKYSIPFRSHRENLEPTVSTDYEFRKCVVREENWYAGEGGGGIFNLEFIQRSDKNIYIWGIRSSKALARTCTHILELSFLLDHRELFPVCREKICTTSLRL